MSNFKRFLSVLLALTLAISIGAAGFAFAADDNAMYAGTDTSQKDSDFDGIPDDIDPKPENSSFSGKIKSAYEGTTYAYTMDFRDFFDDNKTYHPNLGAASILGATLAYYDPDYAKAYFTFDEEQPWNGKSITQTDGIQLLEIMGFEDVVDYSLDEYGDDDLCEVLIAHKTVKYNGVYKVIVALWVRGTESTSLEEWSSNFNVGDLATFFEKYDSVEGKVPRQLNEDWTRKTNHRGFDVCATRLLKYLKAYYLDDYVTPELQKHNLKTPTYWLAGHSRGASVANIMAAYLVDEGAEVYAYTFATPYSTANAEASAGKYDCIFNLVNKNDFIPTLPMPEWGFTRYGKTAPVYASDFVDEVEAATGNDYKGKFLTDEQMAELLEKFIVITGENEDRDNPGKILGWREVYVYHCGHNHVGETNGEYQKTTIKNNVLGIEASEYDGYADRLKKYSYLTDDGICQIPAYDLQILVELLAAVANGETLQGALSYLLDNKLADKYDFSKLSLLEYALKLTDPHYMDTYSVIQAHINKTSDPGKLFKTHKYYTADGVDGGRPAHTHTYEYIAYDDSKPTCTETGTGYMICHCSDDNPEYYDDVVKGVIIPSTGHKWNATYEWAEDFSSVTANCTCDVCKKTETLTATPTVKSKTEATKDKAGSIVYSATFKGSDGKEFTAEKTVEIPAGSTESIAKTGVRDNTVFLTGFTVFCGLSLAVLYGVFTKKKQQG